MTALSLTKATWNVWQSYGKDCRLKGELEREGERKSSQSMKLHFRYAKQTGKLWQLTARQGAAN